MVSCCYLIGFMEDLLRFGNDLVTELVCRRVSAYSRPAGSLLYVSNDHSPFVLRQEHVTTGIRTLSNQHLMVYYERVTTNRAVAQPG